MTSTAAAISGLITLLLTSPVVQSQNGWWVTYRKPTEICALKGSTVTISCTYEYPSTVSSTVVTVEKTLWFTKESNNVHVDLRSDPDYSDRVEYQRENKACTLTIRDLRETDSAEYKFRFITNLEHGRYVGEPGVTLSVTDLQVQVITSTDRRSELRCLNRCSLPDRFTYIWYKNGQKIQGQTSNTYSGYFVDTDRVSCAVRGQELFPSPSVSVHWGVTYTSTQICGSKGSTVVIHCSYRYPSRVNNVDTRVTDRFWFVNNEPLDLKEDSDYSGRVEDQCNGNSCTLTIRDLRETDSAEYKFRFITNHESGRYTGSPGVVLSVSDPQLQVDVRKSTVNQFSTWTELTCHSNCQLSDPHSYIWYKNGEKVERERKEYYILDGFDPSDRYYCTIEVLGHERFRSPPVYRPNLPSVSVSPSEIVEGSSVTLTCSSDANPAANYTWYKGNQTIYHGPEGTIHFTSISSKDKGTYYCKSENQYGNKSSSISVDVHYPPNLPSVSVSPSEIVEGSSVNLTCSSDANPAANYTWYKENEESPKASGQIFTITDIRAEHSGNYYCEAQNIRGRHNNTLHLTVTVFSGSLKSAVIGMSLVFFLAIVLFVFLLIRKTKTSKRTSDPHERPDVCEQRRPTQSEETDDVQYASVHFMKYQTDPIYSNITAAGAQRHGDEDESHKYAAVKFNRAASRTTGQVSGDDPSALYSTVNKIC